MAPKFSSSSNKDKKTIDYAEDGIQETTMALSLVTAAAELAPTPYLRRAAGTTLKIINTAHHVRKNKPRFRRLVDDVARFIAGIWKSYQEIPEGEKVNWPPQELRNVFEELVLILDSISEFIEAQVRRNKIFRVFYNMADAGKIQKYRERVAAMMSQFGNQQSILARLTTWGSNSDSGTQELHTMTGANVNDIESADLLKFVESVKEREEKECALEAERHHFSRGAASSTTTDGECSHHPETDEGASATRAIDEQQFEQVRHAADQAFRVAEEKEKEHKCMRKEEIDYIVAEKESEPQHREEERARVEAQEQAKHLEEERVPIVDHGEKSRRGKVKRMRDILPADQRRKVEADWIAQAEVKISSDPPAEIKKNPKRFEDDDEQQVVDVPEEEEEESEGESDDEAALKAARLTEARRAANKKGRNKTKVNCEPTPSVESAFANMITRPTPTPTPSPISMPPTMAQLSPMNPYQPLVPYDPLNTFRPPVTSTHTGYHEQPLYPPSFFPVTTINNVNSGNISSFSASDINNDNSTKTEEKDHADENQDSECRREEGAHVEAEEQLKWQEEEKTRMEMKDQLGEIDKAKLASAPRPNPTDSASLETSGKEEEEEEKLANEEAKNQQGENNLTSTPQLKTTNSDSLKTSGKSKEEVEKLANETWRAANKGTKVKRASTPPAQRVSTASAQRASGSTQRMLTKLNEDPHPMSQPSFLHRLTHKRRMPANTETNSRRPWNRDQGNEIGEIYISPTPSPVHQRLDDLRDGMGHPRVFQGNRYPYSSSTHASTLQHPSQPFSPYSVLEHNLHFESPISAQQRSCVPYIGIPSLRCAPMSDPSMPAQAPPKHNGPYSGLKPDSYRTSSSFDPTPRRLFISTTAEPSSSPPGYGAPQADATLPPVVGKHPGQPPPGMFLGGFNPSIQGETHRLFYHSSNLRLNPTKVPSVPQRFNFPTSASGHDPDEIQDIKGPRLSPSIPP